VTKFSSYTVGQQSAVIASAENRWRRVVVITVAGQLRVSFDEGGDAGQAMPVPGNIPLLVAPNQSLYMREHTGVGTASGSVIVSEAVEV
jgi:hypothetical protein